MSKTFLEKLVSKKLVGKHVSISTPPGDDDILTFNGIVESVSIACAYNYFILIILLEGFEKPFFIDDSKFKKQVKITKC